MRSLAAILALAGIASQARQCLALGPLFLGRVAQQTHPVLSAYGSEREDIEHLKNEIKDLKRRTNASTQREPVPVTLEPTHTEASIVAQEAVPGSSLTTEKQLADEQEEKREAVDEAEDNWAKRMGEHEGKANAGSDLTLEHSSAAEKGTGERIEKDFDQTENVNPEKSHEAELNSDQAAEASEDTDVDDSIKNSETQIKTKEETVHGLSQKPDAACLENAEELEHIGRKLEQVQKGIENERKEQEADAIEKKAEELKRKAEASGQD